MPSITGGPTTGEFTFLGNPFSAIRVFQLSMSLTVISRLYRTMKHAALSVTGRFTITKEAAYYFIIFREYHPQDSILRSIGIWTGFDFDE